MVQVCARRRHGRARNPPPDVQISYGRQSAGGARSRHGDRGRRGDRLQDDAVALGQPTSLSSARPRRPCRGRSAAGSRGTRRARRGRRRACRGSRGRPRRSPSRRPGSPATVATARIVTPAHAASASSSMSPEHSCVPSPPVAGCRPAIAIARPVARGTSRPPRGRPGSPQRHDRRPGVVAVAILQRA